MQPVSVDEYSLWLEPAPADARKLSALIENIAARSGTPVFEPHLTLLPGLHGEEQKLIETCAQFAHEASFSIPIESAQTGSAYHKCLYVSCAPSEQLVALRKKAEQLFKISPPFFPHISLAYGLDASPREAYKLELAQEKFSFTAQTISLWHAKGLPNEWRRITTHRLI